MQGTILVMLILLIPAVMAPLMLLVRQSTARKFLVSLAAFAMIVVAALLGVDVLRNGTLVITASDYRWVSPAVTILDYLIILVIFYYGVELREWKIIVPTVLQAAAVVYIDFIRRPLEAEKIVVLDNLSLVLTLIVSIMGPLIAVFALGYMQRHDAHRKGESHQPVFFAVIFLFLFAMNAMVISDNLMYFYAFFEITTLCSFLLIGYDDTKDARASARRALWLNSVGGLFLAAGIILITAVFNQLSFSELLAHGLTAGVLTAGVMFLCCAGFVKSAQVPFQSWLLGAMVAPTPVSALLHSSTMVKAGVYLIVRLSPLFGGRLPGHAIAAAGAFTFVATAALAIGQSNGKRVLAYSTISNLGLIIACAGIGGPVATSAAILLILFHAVSKGLMFLCVGTVELGIGSRDIEDMFGIYSKMPYTTVIMTIGIISMVLPPFGVLITKWLALEAAVSFPVALFLIVLGSAFTIAFWIKWLGAVLTVYKNEKPHVEDLPGSIKFALGAICAMVIALTALISPINNGIVMPAVKSMLGQSADVVGTTGGVAVRSASGMVGGFGGVLLLLGVMLAGLVAVRLITAAHKPRMVAPYACGETLAHSEGGEFTGPGDKAAPIRMHNYYLSGLFNESRLTAVSGFISVLLILIMFGVS